MPNTSIDLGGNGFGFEKRPSDNVIDRAMEERLSALGPAVEKPQNEGPSDIDDETDNGSINEVNDLKILLEDRSISHRSTRSVIDGVVTHSHFARCKFEPEQSHYVLHIPLFPPLNSIPTVDSFAFDAESRIRVTDRNRFGIRMEIISFETKLEPTEIIVKTVMREQTSEDSAHP